MKHLPSYTRPDSCFQFLIPVLARPDRLQGICLGNPCVRVELLFLLIIRDLFWLRRDRPYRQRYEVQVSALEPKSVRCVLGCHPGGYNVGSFNQEKLAVRIADTASLVSISRLPQVGQVLAGDEVLTR